MSGFLIFIFVQNIDNIGRIDANGSRGKALRSTIEQLEIVQPPSREQARRDRLELRVMDGGSPLLEGDSLADRCWRGGGS